MNFRRIFSLFLALLMTVSTFAEIIPANAIAAEKTAVLLFTAFKTDCAVLLRLIKAATFSTDITLPFFLTYKSF